MIHVYSIIVLYDSSCSIGLQEIQNNILRSNLKCYGACPWSTNEWKSQQTTYIQPHKQVVIVREHFTHVTFLVLFYHY